MKVLVAGANGQLGRALVATAPVEWDVTGLGRTDMDICDWQAASAACDRAAPDLIVNAAAHTAVDRAESEPEAAAEVNHRAVAGLARICRERAIRLVHVSTDFVFDGTSSRPYLPEDATNPVSVYGRTKLAGEHEALGLGGSLVVRTAWVYAAGGRNFVHTMLRLMGEGRKVEVVADQVGTPTHARSLARAIWSLAKAGAQGTHHFTDAGIASWYDFAVAIAEEAHAIGLIAGAASVRPISTAEYPTPAQRPAYSVLDKSLTWQLLGGPARHWRVELRDMLAQVKATDHG